MEIKEYLVNLEFSASSHSSKAKLSGKLMTGLRAGGFPNVGVTVDVGPGRSAVGINVLVGLGSRVDVGARVNVGPGELKVLKVLTTMRVSVP